MFIRISFLVLSLFAASCSYAPVETKMAFSRVHSNNYTDEALESDDVAITESNKINACNVFVSHLNDKRHSKKSFGTSYRYEKFANNVSEWIETGLLSIKPHHVYFKKLTNENDLILDVDILKAYVHHKTVALNANVVIRVTYLNDGQTQSKLYRGMDTSINWADGSEDIEEGMNAAISEILDEMTIELNKRCRATIISASLSK